MVVLANTCHHEFAVITADLSLDPLPQFALVVMPVCALYLVQSVGIPMDGNESADKSSVLCAHFKIDG